MPRKIGFSLWYGNKSKKELIEQMHSLGFDYVEISLDYPWPYDEYEFSNIIKLTKTIGLEISFHGPWRDIRLASPIDEIAYSSRKVVKKIVDNISKFEPKYFNIHLISEEITFDNKVRDKIISRAKETIRFLEELSEEYSIAITVENNPHGHFSFPTYFTQVGLNSIRFCLDIAHAIVAYYNAGETSYTPLGVISDWINALGKEKIHVIHVHDIVKKNDTYANHYYFGLGFLNLHEISKLICSKTNAKYILLETFRKNRNHQFKVLKENEVIEIIRKNCMLGRSKGEIGLNIRDR